ncbi:DUF1638 domain-containing protein [Tropicimonas isoalkanivorans]|uniref:DUF1638 domain-containing protein n=1 Tax=Tropicimonas isoalkanivorans TaxID=441112 RepID=A0A1I1DCS6_9RHOB|nr:DUF1638 domain-containing protein [Tropicimonas isoalkanivorans]SFB70343.1 Protein of unknown function [Tropicimonas isoalkanivorans]
MPSAPPLPSDSALTEHGLAPDIAAERVLVIGCGALAREILALKAANGWDHIALTCLPAILHTHPERITPAVEAAILKHRDAFDRIFVAYADCGTGGQLQATCDRLGVEMIAGPHCYSFYEGNAAFADRAEVTAFYLTDFLVRQFDAFVWRPLGLDRHPDLRHTYFAHYTTLVHQAQVDDPVLDAKARDCAARLGLAHERRFTGYGDLAHALAQGAAPGA